MSDAILMARDDGAARAADAVRPPDDRLDDVMNRVAELVIAQSRLDQVAGAIQNLALQSVAEEIGRIALDLRDAIVGARMQPVAPLFNRCRRTVRDLAEELGREIELVTSGEETELDKTVIEQLSDPLIRLIRNALDHGAEPSAERADLGERPRGQISLSARRSGAEVIISIADDGRGLDRESPSGRGIDMDEVRRSIEALRGSVELGDAHGEGTVVSLRLPLTLAIIDGLLVRVGEGRYVIPLAAVEECVELPAEVEAGSQSRNILNIRNNLVPYLNLREMFGAAASADAHQKIVIVSGGGQQVGLVVDEVIGDHQTVIKPLSRLHAGAEAFSGATILGDGAVALILEIAHLAASGQPQDEPLKPPARRIGERHAQA